MAGGDVVLLVGTRKGSFTFRSDARPAEWKVSGPRMRGYSAYHMTYDPRDSEVWMAANSAFYGPEIARSSDMGETWRHSEAELRVRDDSERTMAAQNAPDSGV